MVDDVDIASNRSLGLSLTTDDVAATILAVAETRLKLPHSVHRPVGRQAHRLMALALALASVIPSWLAREINKGVAHP